MKLFDNMKNREENKLKKLPEENIKYENCYFCPTSAVEKTILSDGDSKFKDM